MQLDFSTEARRACPKCGASKPLADFPHKGRQRDLTERYGYCKPCHSVYQREMKLRRVFNITPAEYEQMLAHQSGMCAICGDPPKRARLAVDHDHETGLIRGLVCPVCNRGLAYWRDDLRRLQTAMDYLTDPPATVALGSARFGVKGRSQKRPHTLTHYPR